LTWWLTPITNGGTMKKILFVLTLISACTSTLRIVSFDPGTSPDVYFDRGTSVNECTRNCINSGAYSGGDQRDKCSTWCVDYYEDMKWDKECTPILGLDMCNSLRTSILFKASEEHIYLSISIEDSSNFIKNCLSDNNDLNPCINKLFKKYGHYRVSRPLSSST